MAVDEVGGKVARPGGRGRLGRSPEQGGRPARTVAREWYDAKGVDVIVDVPTSSGRARGQRADQGPRTRSSSARAPAARTSPASRCSPNTIQWTFDTWALANTRPAARSSRTAATAGSSSPPTTRSAPSLERDRSPRSSRPAAARCWATSSTRSTPRTSRRSCSRPRARRPRSSAWPTPAAIRSTRSSRRRSSASSRRARSWPASWSSSATSTRSASRPRRASCSARRSTGTATTRPASSRRSSPRRHGGAMPTMRPGGRLLLGGALPQGGRRAQERQGRRQGRGRQDGGDADRRRGVRQRHDRSQRPQAPPDVSSTRSRSRSESKGKWDDYKLVREVPADQAFRAPGRQRVSAADEVARSAGTDSPHRRCSGSCLLGLINGSFYALLSLGLAIIFGLLNVINFAHGALYMLGAFVWLGPAALRRHRLRAGADPRAGAGRRCSASCSSARCCSGCTGSTRCTTCCSRLAWR